MVARVKHRFIVRCPGCVVEMPLVVWLVRQVAGAMILIGSEHGEHGTYPG